MKRQKHKPKHNSGQRANRQSGAETQPSAEGPKSPSGRRDLFRKVASGGLVLAAVGGVGWYFVGEVRATIREEDLSRIGNGIPTVVQIHDPQCPTCRALQREVRDALEAFDSGELQYLVANIRTDEGRRLANAHGVGHVTLLLLDGDGERRDVLAGPNSAAYLESAFRQHIAASGV